MGLVQKNIVGVELFHHMLVIGFLYICYASNFEFKKNNTKLTSNGYSYDASQC
jgi:hypothetical protein